MFGFWANGASWLALLLFLSDSGSVGLCACGCGYWAMAAMTVFVAALVSSSIRTSKEVSCGGAVGAQGLLCLSFVDKNRCLRL